MSDTRYVISVKEAARIIGVAPPTLYAMAARREIDHLRTRGHVSTRVVAGERQEYRVSGRLRFSQAGLDAWIEAHRYPVETSTPARVPDATSLRALMPAKRRFS